MDDTDVPGWWRALGLPGLVDAHVHFLPPPIQRRVREHFDSAGPLIGRAWPLHYRGDDDERVEHLRGMGIRRFTALPYAHKPGVATWMNDWAADLADRVPEVVRSATFYPEDGVADEVVRRLGAGTQVFKLHVQVGDLDPTDPLLDPAWGLLAEAGVAVVVHAGSGPVPGRFTGPGPMATVLERYPRLAVVVAHAGFPEYADFLALAERHERVRLDTTMAFTDFFEADVPYPRALLPRLRELGLAGKVVLGTDFPSIPYPYAHQLEALARLDLGDDWLRAVCWTNPVAALGCNPTTPSGVTGP